MAVFEFLAGKEEDLVLPLLPQSSSPRFIYRMAEAKAPEVSKTSSWRGKKWTEKHDSLEGVLRKMEIEKM
jgi:hypothetical protein